MGEFPHKKQEFRPIHPAQRRSRSKRAPFQLFIDFAHKQE
jgi:hypothetical protein